MSIIDRDLRQVVRNAQAGRELSQIFARTNLLLGTFYRNKNLLETEGNLLLSATNHLSHQSADKNLKNALLEFKEKITPLLEQCAIINGISQKISTVQDELIADLTTLEQIISESRVALVIEGEDTSMHEQLSVSILFFQKDLLKTIIQFSGLDPIQTESGDVESVIALLDELILKLQTFVASDPDIKPYYQKLYNGVVEYKQHVITFDTALVEFHERFTALNMTKERTEAVMREVNKEIIRATNRMREKSGRVMRSSIRFVYGLTGFVILLFGAFTYIFLFLSIRKPMQTICKEITSIGDGNLDTRIQLKRTDEWKMIENALNRMASELGNSMKRLEAEVSQRKQTEETLRESEERFRTIVETVPSLLIITDEKGNNAYVSPNCEKMTGYTQTELIENFTWWVHEEDLQKAQEVFGHAFKEKMGGRNFEYKGVKKNGDIWFGSASWEPLRDMKGAFKGFVMQTTDITERKQAEEQLKSALEAKIALLNEVHHRTRNNMQIMSVLVGFHAKSIEDTHTRQFLKGFQDRIDAMSMVHQKLHRTDLTTVNLKDYIEDLARTLQISHQVSSRRISFTFDVEAVSMTIDTAVPFGLLFNELLSNTLKHAFPDDRKGEIHIGLHTTDEGKRELRVSDNGVGLPEGFEMQKANSLGVRLMIMLARQLQGTVEFQRKTPGTEVIVRFKEPYYEKRI